MNYKLNISAGGIFSKYMVGIQNAALYEAQSYYFNISDSRTNSDMFDNIFTQDSFNFRETKECRFLGTYSKYKLINASSNLNKYKNIIDKMKFNDHFLEKFNDTNKKLNVDDSMVGVHIRLTDMNIYHKDDYGALNFQDFKNHFNENTRYFVSSDNEESLIKLKELYGDNIVYNENFIRCAFENDDSIKLQLENFRNNNFWIEAFIEMLLLSKCGSLVCRSSNLSNVAILYSNTFKNITML